MPDIISDRDRALIDAHIAQNGVNVIAPGVSSQELIWDKKTNSLRYKADLGDRRPGARWRQNPASIAVAKRRSVVRALAEGGMSVVQMLEHMRAGAYPAVSEDVVRGDLRAMGVSAKTARQVALEARRTFVRSLHDQGLSVSEIAAHSRVEVSARVIRGYLSEMGLKAHPETPRPTKPRRTKRGRRHAKTFEVMDQVEVMVKAGRPYVQIAKEVGLCVGSVANYVSDLKKLGRLPDDFHAQIKARNDELFAGRVLKRAKAGMNREEIAADIGAGVRRVQDMLRDLRAAGKLPTRSELRRARHEEVKRLIGEGLTGAEVAEVLGVPPSTIHQDMRHLGLRTRYSVRSAA